MLIVGIIAPGRGDATPDGILRLARRALATGAEMIEARLDLWPEGIRAGALAGLRRGVTRRIILTIRRRSDGGAYAEDASGRLKLIEALARRGDWVDLEIDEPAACLLARRLRARGVRVLASRHHFGVFPSLAKLRAWLRAGKRMGDAVKIAVMVRAPRETVRLLDFARRAAAETKGRDRLTVIGMGKHGLATRIELPREIGGFAYAPLGRAVAPGQIPLRWLVGRAGIEPAAR